MEEVFFGTTHTHTHIDSGLIMESGIREEGSKMTLENVATGFNFQMQKYEIEVQSQAITINDSNRKTKEHQQKLKWEQQGGKYLWRTITKDGEKNQGKFNNSMEVMVDASEELQTYITNYEN